MTDPVVLLSTGDVVGPNTSTDGTMVLFDGVTGKKIKGNNAVVTIQALALLDDIDAAANRETIGLGNVDNTSDLNKPVSTKQAAAILAGATRVVSLPTVTGASSGNVATVVTLTATAASLLTNGSIASFTWQTPDGAKTTVAASSNSASMNVTLAGSIGFNYTVTVFATDTVGNLSAIATKSIAIINHRPPSVPTITVATEVYKNSTGNVITVTGSVATDGASITYSLTQSGTAAVTFSQTTGITAGQQVTFSVPSVSYNTPLTISAVAVDSLGGVSTQVSNNITIALVPTIVGAPYGGGFYTGRMIYSGVNYALVTSPKAYGEYVATATAYTSTTTNSADGYTIVQGPPSSLSAATGVGGWQVPDIFMYELMYRVFKPDSTVNSHQPSNPYSVPAGPNYTDTLPAQTTIPPWAPGGAEAFTTAYWSQSKYSSNANYLSLFTTGAIDGNGGWYGGSNYVRAVRLVAI